VPLSAISPAVAGRRRPASGSEKHFHGAVCGSLGDATWHRDRVLPCRIRSQQPGQPVTFPEGHADRPKRNELSPTETQERR
jgi:hypothetical protein